MLVLALILASCGLEPGYESLEVQYEGVPLNLDRARVEDPTASIEQEPPTVLAHVDDEVAEAPATSTPAGTSTSSVPQAAAEAETEHQAHRDPVAEQPPAAVAEPEVESVSGDARIKKKDEAIIAFGELLAEATTLGPGSIACFVDYVEDSGVNAIPMNRVLRRAMDGSTEEPNHRYVALANDAARACGVSLSPGILR